MIVGVQHQLFHRRQIVLEGRIRLHFRSNRQQIDAVADQARFAGHRLASNAEANHKISLIGQPMKQRFQPGHQQHHQRCTLLARHLLQRLLQLRIEIVFQRSGFCGAHQRPRMINRQIERRRNIRKLRAPVGHRFFRIGRARLCSQRIFAKGNRRIELRLIPHFQRGVNRRKLVYHQVRPTSRHK